MVLEEWLKPAVAVEIGIKFMQTFKANWPEGFLDIITKQITAFA